MDGATKQAFSGLVRNLSQRLALDAFEPVAGRLTSDDRRLGELIGDVERLLDEIARAPRGSDDQEPSDEQLHARGDAARVLGQAAAVVLAAGVADRATAWLERARELVPLPPDRAVFDEALQSPALFQRLMLAQWHYANDRHESARKLAKLVQREAGEKPAILAVATAIANVETPLAHAPMLMTLNGFGVRIYGKRDAREDGSYIGTRYVTALFVPVFPIDSFRMADAGGGKYYFLARAPLSRAAEVWRSVAAVGALVLAVGGGIGGYLSSAGYKLSRSIEAAQQQESRAKTPVEREAAIAGYEALIEQAEDVEPKALAPAALGIAHLLNAGLPRPLQIADVDVALKAEQRFASIPAKIRAGEPTEYWCQRTQGFATTLEKQGESGLYGARRLLSKANRLCEGTQASVAPALGRVRLALARLDAGEWPLLSIADYAEILESPESIAESAKLIDQIADDEVSVWHELAPSLSRWLKAAQGSAEHSARSTRVSERLAAAEAYFSSPERRALAQDAPRDALSRAVAAKAGDQELRVALASHDPEATALASLAQIGPPGKMTRSTALVFAELLQRTGKLTEAEEILEHLVQRLLPEYEDARGDYAVALSAFYANWYEKARAGELPDDIQSKLRGLSDEQAPQVFDKWVGERSEEDPGLRARLERAQQTNEAVPTVLSLGTLKLMRASQQSGAEQAQTLAAAERLFLAIGSDAEGVPAYHLGLAQVYYRLGKISEGEREFGELLGKGEPSLQLSVARAYREVGAITRARAVTEAVYEKNGSPHREGAALLMSLMADTVDDRRTWLTRADQNNPLVQTNLLELEADSACSKGQEQEGDRKYRDAARRHLEGSDLDESSFNNAALAEAARVSCTGQRAPLDEAISLMQRALRLAPTSSLLAENATPLHEYRGALRVLSRWLDPSALHLSSSSAMTLIEALEDGPHRDELLSALKSDPDVKQARELSRHARVLAPTHPDPYMTEMAWLQRFEDAPGLSALIGAVRSQKLDTAPLAATRKQWLEGKLDNTRREQLLEQEAKLARLIAALPASQGASLAALRYLEGDVATSLMDLEDPLPRAEQALKAFEAADRLWPAIGARRRLPNALLVAAAVRAGTQLPALASRLRSDMREFGWSLTMGRLIDEGDAAVLSAIKAQPEFTRAVEIARQAPAAAATEHPISWDWFIARLTDDNARADQLAAGIFDHEAKLWAELNQLLAPSNASDTYAAFTELHMPKALATP